MNFGQRGTDLLLNLKRSDWLPVYDDDNVCGTLKEVSLHYNELKSLTSAAVATTAASASTSTSKDAAGAGADGASSNANTSTSTTTVRLPEEFKPALLLHQAALQRNKRCLLAYHAFRMDKLKELRREGATSVLAPHHRALLSESEQDFYAQYDTLMSHQSVAVDLDLSSHINPPEDDFIEVRVAQPGVGRITTEDGGSVLLEHGTTHFLRRGDVEHLIRRGVLHQLNVEENG
jgi:GINS complex subunit 1